MRALEKSGRTLERKLDERPAGVSLEQFETQLRLARAELGRLEDLRDKVVDINEGLQLQRRLEQVARTIASHEANIRRVRAEIDLATLQVRLLTSLEADGYRVSRPLFPWLSDYSLENVLRL